MENIILLKRGRDAKRNQELSNHRERRETQRKSSINMDGHDRQDKSGQDKGDSCSSPFSHNPTGWAGRSRRDVETQRKNRSSLTTENAERRRGKALLTRMDRRGRIKAGPAGFLNHITRLVGLDATMKPHG